MHISVSNGSNAGYTMFRGSVKGIGYPLHSPVSPSLPLPYVTVCHHISTGLYYREGRYLDCVYECLSPDGAVRKCKNELLRVNRTSALFQVFSLLCRWIGDPYACRILCTLEPCLGHMTSYRPVSYVRYVICQNCLILQF